MFDVKIIDADGNDVTVLYSFEYPQGAKLTITTRAITVETLSKTVGYDGNNLTYNEYSISGDGLAEGDTIVLMFTGMQEDFGSCDNTVDISKTTITNESGEDVTKNYVISYMWGKLEITFPL